MWQGTAYENIPEGTYYPALSLYTLPHQRQGATLTVNFGTTCACLSRTNLALLHHSPVISPTHVRKPPHRPNV